MIDLGYLQYFLSLQVLKTKVFPFPSIFMLVNLFISFTWKIINHPLLSSNLDTIDHKISAQMDNQVKSYDPRKISKKYLHHLSKGRGLGVLKSGIKLEFKLYSWMGHQGFLKLFKKDFTFPKMK
jgi:hypothetical protein